RSEDKRCPCSSDWDARRLVICIPLFSSIATLNAQTLSGIRGTVTDQSGLAVSGAKVSVDNGDTGVRRSTETVRQEATTSLTWSPALTQSPWKNRDGSPLSKRRHRCRRNQINRQCCVT